jgi:phage terminase large subunit-like protein
MADTDYIRQAQERENIRFPITELGGKLSKVERVDKFVPVFSNRKFYLPESLDYVDFEGRSHDLVDELKYEMINFPRGHDDCIDAISRIVDPSLGVVYPNADGEKEGKPEFGDFEFSY